MIKYTIIAASVVVLIMYLNRTEHEAMDICLDYQSEITCINEIGAQ